MEDLSLLYEIGNIQEQYKLLRENNLVCSESFQDIERPFRDRYLLTHCEAWRIIVGDMSILDMANLFSEIEKIEQLSFDEYREVIFALNQYILGGEKKMYLNSMFLNDEDELGIVYNKTQEFFKRMGVTEVAGYRWSSEEDKGPLGLRFLSVLEANDYHYVHNMIKENSLITSILPVEDIIFYSRFLDRYYTGFEEESGANIGDIMIVKTK